MRPVACYDGIFNLLKIKENEFNNTFCALPKLNITNLSI